MSEVHEKRLSELLDEIETISLGLTQLSDRVNHLGSEIARTTGLDDGGKHLLERRTAHLKRVLLDAQLAVKRVNVTMLKVQGP